MISNAFKVVDQFYYRKDNMSFLIQKDETDEPIQNVLDHNVNDYMILKK
jgi:hypothetical protein